MKFLFKQKYLISLIFFTFILVMLQINLAEGIKGFPFLFGDQKEAIFDWWSFEHILVGVMVGLLVVKIDGDLYKSTKQFVFLILAIAVGWEIFELLMEYGRIDLSIIHWRNGYENWANRLIGDPLMNTLGAIISFKIDSFLKK